MKNPFSEYKKISQNLLGINARNKLYIDNKSINISNSKIKVKNILNLEKIPTPETLFIIKSLEELENFDFSLLPKSFVIKPNKGLGGEGIIIFYGKKKKRNEREEDAFISANKQIYSLSDIKSHIFNILNGYYSINKKNDIAIFEKRIINSEFLKQNLKIKEGLPDIRIIIYKKFPIMAELRIPTIESKGKANLHSGGIGVGIDIARGISTNAISKDEYIEINPDTGERLSGIKIPYWNNILEMAIKSSIAINSSFTGVDIALDKEKGPLVMEVNARPGLAIQIANKSGLKERLESVSKLKVKNAKSAINISKEIFGGEIDEEIEEITGKIVIGRVVKVKIQDTVYSAKIDTGAYFSSISDNIAKDLGFGEKIEIFKNFQIPETKDINTLYNLKNKLEKENHDINISLVKSANGITIRPLIDISIYFIEEDITIDTRVSISDRSNLLYDILIGRKDLKNFLIDITK